MNVAQLFTEKDAAKELGLRYATLTVWREMGLVKPLMQISRRVIYNRSELDRIRVNLMPYRRRAKGWWLKLPTEKAAE